MRTSFLLLLLASGVVSLSTPGCGGKLTNAETLELQQDGAILTGGTTTGSGGSDTTGGAGGGSTGGGNTGGGNTGTTGSGTGGTADPPTDPTGGSGGATGTGGTGGTGVGGSGPTVDASPGCPEQAPASGTDCAGSSVMCRYDTTTCACMTSGGGGGGNRRDAGMTWSCSGAAMDAGRSGRG
jgi:hypothetical protein